MRTGVLGWAAALAPLAARGQRQRAFQHGLLVLVLLASPVTAQQATTGERAESPQTAPLEVASPDVSRALGPPAGPPRSGLELDRLTEELAHEMRCPVCQGLSIAASRSISALNMKAEVRELLAAGYSPDQVLDYFEQSYGEFVRLIPKPKGFNLLVWILPFAALVVGGVSIAALRGRQRRDRVQTVRDVELDAYRQRVLEETAGD